MSGFPLESRAFCLKCVLSSKVYHSLRMGMFTLESSVDAVPGAGKAYVAVLGRMGVRTVRDLVLYFPNRYEDFSATPPIGKVTEAMLQATVIGTVEKVANRRSFGRRMSISEAIISDESGKTTATWFNRPYLVKQLRVGETYRFAGKVSKTRYGLRLLNPLFEVSARGSYLKPFMPVYSTVDGMSQHTLRKIISATAPVIAEMEETLPNTIRARHHLLSLGDAVRLAHFPASAAERDAARKRLGFDEVLALQLSIGRLRRMREVRGAVAVPFNKEAVQAFTNSLPFALTGDQKKAAWAIIGDMEKGVPMYRLLDGDVGSGKTLVAAVAMVNAVRAGYQSTLMAPTEILASQHYETLTKVLKGHGVRVALWTSSYHKASRDGVEALASDKKAQAFLLQEIANGEIDVVVGTHALIEEALKFGRLALAVVDEQHRFGVNARKVLATKSGMPDVEPHLLSMTATPIPRSLALTVFGDLDLSVIKEKPKGRVAITTVLVPRLDRAAAFEKVRKEVAAGRQAFVVCPLIDPSDKLGVSSVSAVAEQLAKEDLNGIAIGMLHGKMKSEEKERVMREMCEGKIKVLVSTSVIEVGVDVPNASVMCIEGAERFGLAQLHQFRGRVGRAEHASWCFLMPSAGSEEDRRLSAMTHISDGFVLAEKDLELRGPGDFLGTAQSGQAAFSMVSFSDVGLIAAAKDAAKEILDSDPELTQHEGLRAMMRRAADGAHLE